MSLYRTRLDGSEKTKPNDQQGDRIGVLEDMCIVDGRIHFRNSLDSLKFCSMDLTGKDIRCEGDLTELCYLTFWDGKM